MFSSIRTIAGTSLIAAAIGLATLGAAGPANADAGCVNYSDINRVRLF
ncbi:MAG: hypothetical protein ACM4D3_07340 [Candidatus Sericytochromatia bacterium]